MVGVTGHVGAALDVHGYGVTVFAVKASTPQVGGIDQVRAISIPFCHEGVGSGTRSVSASRLVNLADIVSGYIPDTQITFENEGGLEESGNYLVDNSRLLSEFELEYPPFPTRVLQTINAVRQQEGMPLVEMSGP